MTQASFCQFRAFVGPRFEAAPSPYAFNWTVVNDVDGLAGAAGVVTDAGVGYTVWGFDGFIPPTSGGLWVGPNGAGQGWEYLAYSGRLGDLPMVSGCVWEDAAVREHNGVHSVGAPIYCWFPIASDDGKLHFTHEMSDDLASISWRATLTGVVAPRAVLRPNHCVLVQRRFTYDGAWETWFIGFIDKVTVGDDYRRLGAWSLELVSVAGMLARVPFTPTIVGKFKTKGKVLKQDTPLAAAYKEVTSGDYVAAAPDFSAESAFDGDRSTLWIAERVVGTRTSGAVDSSGVLITQLFVCPPPGLGKGYRWIEVMFLGGDDRIWDATICNHAMVSAFCHWQGGCAPGARFVICENLATFKAMNPCQDAKRICEIGSEFFDSLNLAADAVALYKNFGSTWYGSTLAWGDIGLRPRLNHEGHQIEGGAMPGAHPLPTPQPGKVLRFHYTAGAADLGGHYYQDSNDHAGYDYNAHYDPFWLVRLPVLNLTLDRAVAADAGGTWYPWNGSNYSTNGLDASGVIQIGAEQISYVKADAQSISVQARGVNGTTAAAHAAGDVIYQVANGVATDAFLYTGLGWTHSGGSCHPADFKVYGTASAVQPRYPLDADQDPMGNYAADYALLADVAGNQAAGWATTFASARRLGWLLFICKKTYPDPGRVRFNEFECVVDKNSYAASSWLASDAGVGALLQGLGGLLGVPGGVSVAALPAGYATAKLDTVLEAKNAWAVLLDLCDYLSLRVEVSLRSQLTIRPNPVWQTATESQSALFTWSRTNAESVQFLAERSGAVGQVRLRWLQVDGSEGGTVVYPATPSYTGTVETLKDAVYLSAEMALAALQRRYLVARFPHSIGVKCYRFDTAVEPGQFHAVSWDFADGLALRCGVVASSDVMVQEQGITQAVRLLQIREDFYGR